MTRVKEEINDARNRNWRHIFQGPGPSESEGESGHTFSWREHDAPDKTGMTVWSIFPGDTKYFDPGTSAFMINYRVEGLPALLEQLRGEGVTVDSEIQEYPYGRFAWISDPEGNRIELWEPCRGIESRRQKAATH